MRTNQQVIFNQGSEIIQLLLESCDHNKEKEENLSANEIKHVRDPKEADPLLPQTT